MKVYAKTTKNTKLVKELEKLQYAVESMERIIKLCLDDRFFNVDSSQFKSYQDQCEAALKKFNLAKAEFEKQEIVPDFKGYDIRWYLDYVTCEITVEVLNDE